MALIDDIFRNDTNLIFQSDTIQIEVDLLMSAGHARAASIPEDPVETGTVTDQIINGQRIVSVQGFVTNHPVVLGGESAIPNRVQDVFDKLDELYDSREPFAVLTRRKVYENMAFESLALPESVDEGTDSMMFTATLKQITIQTAVSVAIPADILAEEDRGALQSQTDAGRQPTKQATESEGGRASLLFGLFN